MPEASFLSRHYYKIRSESDLDRWEFPIVRGLSLSLNVRFRRGIHADNPLEHAQFEKVKQSIALSGRTKLIVIQIIILLAFPMMLQDLCKY